MPRLSKSQLLERYRQHDRRALAQLISLAENGAAPDAPELSDQAHSLVLGVTGSGGAGKSTLIAALVERLREEGKTVAVLACDPASPKSGGSLLGDRIRQRFAPDDEGVYFRSLSTRGAPGGISAAISAAMPWLHGFGFDVILIETVGVGQDQVAVSEVVDVLLLVVTPGAGDEIQWAKAGLIELADIVVVNKADLPAAERVREQLVSALSLSRTHDSNEPEVPVLLTTATTGEGLDALLPLVMNLRPRD